LRLTINTLPSCPMIEGTRQLVELGTNWNDLFVNAGIELWISKLPVPISNLPCGARCIFLSWQQCSLNLNCLVWHFRDSHPFHFDQWLHSVYKNRAAAGWSLMLLK
jgi:hypothetical protein